MTERKGGGGEIKSESLKKSMRGRGGVCCPWSYSEVVSENGGGGGGGRDRQTDKEICGHGLS